jgi:hypothetical protein
MKRGFDMTVATATTAQNFHSQRAALPEALQPPKLVRTPGAQFLSGSSASGEIAAACDGRASSGLFDAPLLAPTGSGSSSSGARAAGLPWSHAATRPPFSTAHPPQQPGAPARPRPAPVDVRAPQPARRAQESPPPAGRLSFCSALAGPAGSGGSDEGSDEGFEQGSDASPPSQASAAAATQGSLSPPSVDGCSRRPGAEPGPPRLALSPTAGLAAELAHDWSYSDDDNNGEGDQSARYGDGEFDDEGDSLAGTDDGDGSQSSQSSEESEGCSRQLVWPQAGSRASSLSVSPLLESAFAAAAAARERSAQAAGLLGLASSLGSSMSSGWSDNAGSATSSVAADSPARGLSSSGGRGNSSGGLDCQGGLAPLHSATLLTPRSGGVVLRSSVVGGRDSTDPFRLLHPPSPSRASASARPRVGSGNFAEHTPPVFGSAYGGARSSSSSSSGDKGRFGSGVAGVPGSRGAQEHLRGTGAEKVSPREEGSFPRRPRLRAAHRFHSPPTSAGSSDQLPSLSRPLNPVSIWEIEKRRVLFVRTQKKIVFRRSCVAFVFVCVFVVSVVSLFCICLFLRLV